MNKSKKGYDGSPQAKERRAKVISRLETQLKNGMKPVDKDISVALEDKDIKRIKKELGILQSRV